VDLYKSQRHTCLGAGRGMSQANGAAIRSKHPELCQHEIISRILKKWKQCGPVQASCGCLLGHVCMGVRISFFAPYFCDKSNSGLDEYADGCKIKKEQISDIFLLGGVTGGGIWGVGGPSEGSTLESGHAFQKFQKTKSLLGDNIIKVRYT